MSQLAIQAATDQEGLQAELLSLGEKVKYYSEIVRDPKSRVRCRKDAAVRLLETERRLNEVWFQLHFE